MAYHDELITHAEFLATLPHPPCQADMRRAVSAAYYALFHLLTSEAASNWKNINQQARFARMFDHAKMKNASSKISNQKAPTDPALVTIFENLKLVADNFVTLQQERHSADYDNSKIWSRTQVFEAIIQAQDAMRAWMIIRNEGMAQDFLFDFNEGGKGNRNDLWEYSIGSVWDGCRFTGKPEAIFGRASLRQL
jgi:hypothetical protein